MTTCCLSHGCFASQARRIILLYTKQGQCYFAFSILIELLIGPQRRTYLTIYKCAVPEVCTVGGKKNETPLFISTQIIVEK